MTTGIDSEPGNGELDCGFTGNVEHRSGIKGYGPTPQEAKQAAERNARDVAREAADQWLWTNKCPDRCPLVFQDKLVYSADSGNATRVSGCLTLLLPFLFPPLYEAEGDCGWVAIKVCGLPDVV